MLKRNNVCDGSGMRAAQPRSAGRQRNHRRISRHAPPVRTSETVKTYEGTDHIHALVIGEKVTGIACLRSRRRGVPRRTTMLLYAFTISYQRLPAFSGAADHRQDHTALVRRFGGGVDHLPAVFSDGAAAGVPVRARAGAVLEAARANDGAWRAAAGERAGAAGLSQRLVETGRAERSLAQDSGAAGGHGGPALFPAFDHRPAVAGLVRAALSRGPCRTGFTRSRMPAPCSRC